MPKPKSNKGRYNFLIDKKVYKDFSIICEELGIIRSKKLELFMKQFIEKYEEILEEKK